MPKTDSFYNLGPDLLMKACESAGFAPTGEFQQLNSYENRVFQVNLEESTPIIVKFYRPNRWSKLAILDEHQFLEELQSEGIEVAAPLKIKIEKLNQSTTVAEFAGLMTTFFPKIRGRNPQEFLSGDLEKVGNLLARVHNVGSLRQANHRQTMDETFIGTWQSLDEILKIIPIELAKKYGDIAVSLIESFEDNLDPNSFIRIHGDCHRGNLIEIGSHYVPVDFDDFCNGPPVQDFWMLLSGDQDEEDLEKILSGYSALRDFPREQLQLIPILKGVRIISYAAWIAKRWQDPSFPKIFPHFGTYSYWAEEIEALNQIMWKVRT